jgi:LuxR family maltose regulon positive regulatory protein
MLETLLQTKLYVPPLRPNLVSRPQLIERLNQGLNLGHKLTLISAPAGYGKTTLVSEWVTSCKRPVAWLSLDKGDNDLTLFLAYLVASLQTVAANIGEGVLAMLQSSQSPPVETTLAALLNEIAIIPDSIVLVLDDYHLVDALPVDNALTFLLDHLPPQLHLVIATRSDPNLSLARLRARGQLTELRAANLHFAPSEVAGFLNQMMGLNLSAEDIAALETRTEGWIAGLQLAALSIQHKKDVAGFISEFAGDDRYIVDYLVDEVLAQRPSGTKDFLLQTSILNRLTGPLCDAVTGHEDGQKLLEILDETNLFIVPLDNRRRWYRYHHLFADMLRQRLAETASSREINTLHQRASQWCEENDFVIEAVEHALAAEDFDNVIRLAELGAMEILMQGQQSVLLKWQGELPRELVASRPRFCMTIAWAWLSIGHTREAEACLQLLEQSLGKEMVALYAVQDRAEKIDPAIQVVLVEIAVMRIELAIEGGDIAQVFKLSQLVLPYLEDEERPHQDSHLENLRSVVFFVLGLAYKISGELSEAGEALSKAAVLGRQLGNVYVAAGSVGRLAGVQAMQGHLDQAVRTCKQGLKLVQEMVGEPPMFGLIHAELGNLLFERNDLEAALHHLQEGVDLAKPWGFLEAFVPGYMGLARLKAAQGEWSEAFAVLDELMELGQRNPEAVMPAVEAFRAKLWAAQGNVESAGMWAETSGLHVDGELSYLREGESIILVRVLMAQKRWDAAVGLIGRLLEVTENGGRWGRVIELLILQALALDAQGQSDEALRPLSQALTLGKPQGYVRIFVDEGEPMAHLLYRAAAHGITPGYTGALLAALQNLRLAPVGESEVREPISGIIDPLSVRELEVLDCLAEGLSNREIAQQLTISLTTVKTHTRNIYRKLDVNSRTQAVARGKALGII